MAGDSPLPSPGDVLAGKYRIERLIGRGGMGAVFAAEHILLNQRVAVKLLLGELASSAEATNRFMNEARAAAQIRGEHVARVLDIGQLPTGAPYMVLEFLEGSDLSDVLHRRGVLTIPEVADYALQALDALGQAHAAGIVHRDLKPANLFLAKRHDGTSVVKVLDFGISKNLTPLAGTPQGLTQTRALLGSPEYMSPEQLRTPRGVDARTDIWSLGVILYELLTGRMPFTGDALGELFMQIMESNPLPVRSHRAEVPAALDAVVMRCLSRDPNGRFANVGELAEMLKVFASDQMRALIAARASAPGVVAVKPMIAKTTPMVPTAQTAPPNTAAPWANTGGSATQTGGLPMSKRGKIVAIIAAGVLFAVMSVIGLMALLRRGTAAEATPAASPGLVIDTSAAPPSASSTELAPPAVVLEAPQAVPPPASKPPSGTVATNVAATATSAASTGGKPTAAPPSKPTATATTAGVVVNVAPLAPQPAAVPPAKNCNPNYYFDKDGRKHFKPECF